MSGLAANVGLFSGLPTGDIIEQLMALQARPLTRVQTRIADLQTERAAYGELNARLLALRASASQFDTRSFFRAARAISSSPDIMTATAREGAALGNYAFRVQSLVSVHQMISSGFADADTTPVGAGTIAIEMGQGQVAPATDLSILRGGQGIGRGTIKVQDQAGGIAEIDLTETLTVQDVVDRINSDGRVQVRAATSGDRLVLTDESGGTGILSVSDVGRGTAARDLGLDGSVAAQAGRSLTGDDVIDLDESTPLVALNDGNGVHRNTIGEDLVFIGDGGDLFTVELNNRMGEDTHLAQLNSGGGVDLGVVTVRTRDGQETEIDLAAEFEFSGGGAPRTARTNADVLEMLNAAAPAGTFEARLDINSNQFVLTDASEGDGVFQVLDVEGHAAADLGLTTAAEEGVIRGAEVFRIGTIGDVVRAINYATGNMDVQTGERRIEAVVDADGLKLTSAQDFTVERGVTGERVSEAADDLGILGESTGGELQSRRLLAGLNTVLLSTLNGGAGLELGTLEITAASGAAVVVDLTAVNPETGRPPETLQDVIDRINEVSSSLGINVHAEVNSAGHGLSIVDRTDGSGVLAIADTTAARSLQVADVTAVDGVVRGGNLQLRYVARSTPVSTLNQGAGLGTGTFEITASNGSVVRVGITKNQRTVGDVLQLINTLAGDTAIRGALNDTGDGIIIRDETGGSGALTITDDDGTVAHDLRLTGEAVTTTTERPDPDQPGETVTVEAQVINGRQELLLEIDADDTLNDVAEKINSAGFGLAATVINDGSSLRPNRLSLSSAVSGTAGELVIDTGTTGLDLSTLVAARDAVVFFGSAESTNPVVLRSSTNSLSGVIKDVTIDLVGTSDEVVELSVGRDVDSIVESIDRFVSSYNDVISRIDELTFFDSESLEGGILRGDATMRRVEDRLRGMIRSLVPTGDDQVRRLADIGITVQSGGVIEVEGESVAAASDGSLTFDQARFREVFADDPDAIETFFTLTETLDLTRIAADGTTQPVIDPDSGEQQQELRALGFGHRIEDIIDLLTRSGDGLLTLRDEALQGQEDLFNRRAEAIRVLLDAKRSRLERQFATLEQSISSLNGQQSSLSALQAQFG